MKKTKKIIKYRRKQTKKHTHKQTKKQKGGKYVGKGAFGCVYMEPPLTCETDETIEKEMKNTFGNNTNLVSKLQLNQATIDEYDSNHIVDLIDPTFFFHMKSIHCKYDENDTNYKQIMEPIKQMYENGFPDPKCNVIVKESTENSNEETDENFNEETDENLNADIFYNDGLLISQPKDKLGLLIMENGGQTLEKVLDDFNKNPPLSKDEVDILLVDLFRQLVGIKKLQTGLTDADLPYENKIGFVHFDIKSDNIMINENKRSNMIDFGSVVEYYKPLKNIKESTDITEKYDYKSIGINTNKYSPELYYLFGDTSFGENIYEHILDNERIRNKMCGNGIFEGEISDKNKNALIKLSTKKYTERLNRAKNEIKKYIVDGNINDEFHKRYFYKIMETIDVCLFGYLIKNILSNVGNVLSIESFKKLLNLADDMIHPWVGIRKDINKCVNEYRKIVDEENFIETYENSLLYRDNKLVKYIYENNNFT